MAQPDVSPTFFQTPFVRALLIPVKGEPRHVQVQVAPSVTPKLKEDILDDEDLQEEYSCAVSNIIVQNAAFAILAEHTPQNSVYRKWMSMTRKPSSWNGSTLPDSVMYAMILDSATFDPHEVIFFNGDNGNPNGIRMMQTLPVNENLGKSFRGPVLVFKSEWVEWLGGDFRKFEDIGSFTKELKEEVINNMKRRYKDAGL